MVHFQSCVNVILWWMFFSMNALKLPFTRFFFGAEEEERATEKKTSTYSHGEQVILRMIFSTFSPPWTVLMLSFEPTVLLICRFIFPKYHKIFISSRKPSSRHYLTSYLTLFRFATVLSQLIHAVTYLLRYLHFDLRVLITHVLYVTDILYRALLFILWASVVQSYFSYLEPHYPVYEEIPLGAALLAGIHFSRLLDHLNPLKTPYVPCLYLPVTIFLSELRWFLNLFFASYSPIEKGRYALLFLHYHFLAFAWITQRYYATDIITRAFITVPCIYLHILVVALCRPLIPSTEWRRT